MGSNNYTKNT